MNSTDNELDAILRSLDPAAHGGPLATAERRDRDRVAILAQARSVPVRPG